MLHDTPHIAKSGTSLVSKSLIPTEAVKFDTENGITLWQDAASLELTQLHDYHCFNDLGPNATLPPDHHQISVQFIYDVKEDGHYQGCLVAHGDFTPEPEEAVYTGAFPSPAYGLLPFLLSSINNTLCKAILAMLILNLSPMRRLVSLLDLSSVLSMAIP